MVKGKHPFPVDFTGQDVDHTGKKRDIPEGDLNL